MRIVVRGLRLALAGGLVLALGTLTGCGGNNGSSSGGSGTSSTAGIPPTTSGEHNTSGAVTLSWDAPTENADGSQLQDLTGYRVHYGSAPKSYDQTIQVDNAGLTTYVVDNLPAGQYYFAITAYNSKGTESSLSGEVATMVD